MKKKKFIILITFFFILQSIVSSSVIKEDLNNQNFNNQKSKWTLLFYYAADNHRTYEIDKMLDLWKSIGSNDEFKIVNLIDGVEDGDTVYYLIEKDSLINLSWPEQESDMGDAVTLECFLNLSIKNFPSDNYALFIMSTHGSGWQGLGSDTSGTLGYEKLTLLNMKDYTYVFERITKDFDIKIDIVAFDICVTAMIEVAYQIKDYCSYMIGTEEHGFGEAAESDEGVNLEWNYSFFINNLKENPDMTPEEFSISIVESYIPGTYSFKIFERFTAPDWFPILRCYSTISAINLSRFDNTKNAISNLSSLLYNNLDFYKKSIDHARSEVREYGKLYRKFWFLPSLIYYLHLDFLGYDCFIDVYDFANKLKTNSNDEKLIETCSDVTNNLDLMIIGNNVLETDNSHGLSIYFPEYKCQYDASIWKIIGMDNFNEIPVKYSEIDFSKDTLWDKFLQEYLIL